MAKQIKDNTLERKLNRTEIKLKRVDELINESKNSLKCILNNKVELPYYIGLILNDIGDAISEWDNATVIRQINAFTAIEKNIPNKRIVESVRKWTYTMGFHYNGYLAISALTKEFESLVELVRSRQEIKKDLEYNSIILKDFDEIYRVIEWLDSSEDIDGLELKINEIELEEGISLKVKVSNLREVEEFDDEFKFLDGLSIKEILKYEKEKKDSFFNFKK